MNLPELGLGLGNCVMFMFCLCFYYLSLAMCLCYQTCVATLLQAVEKSTMEKKQNWSILVVISHEDGCQDLLRG